MNKLSARFVETNSKPGLANDGFGLYLKTKPSGAKSWIFRFASPITRKKRDMGLGTYPIISLAKARPQVLRYRIQILDGLDPIRVRDEERRELFETQYSPTFSVFATEHHSAIKDQWKNKKHSQQWINTLKTHAFPVIGAMQLCDINIHDVLSVLEPIWKTKIETATRVRQRIEEVWNAGKLKGYVSGDNPARWKGYLELVLPAPSKISPVKHHKAMPYRDVPRFIETLQSKPSISALALEFLVLTACRASEVRFAVWSEIDLQNGIWIIPKERMKADREHRVPLSARCLEIFHAVGGNDGYVFKRNQAGSPLSDSAFRMLLRRIGLDTYTPHGFRSSFRDWAAENAPESSDVIEMCLGHTVGSATELAYKRTDLINKRRACINGWAEFLCG